MTFAPGDHVHVAFFGRGIVREARNGRRYLVEVKGRAMEVSEGQLSAMEAPKRQPRAATTAGEPAAVSEPSETKDSIDLHGLTQPEAEAALDTFLNDALLAGLADVRVIHGRSGGRVKAAVHARLRAVPAVRAFRLDPSNPGVTVVRL